MTSFARVCLMATLALAVICAFVLAGSEAKAFPSMPVLVDTRSAMTRAIRDVLKDRPVFKEDVGDKEAKSDQLDVLAPAIARASGGDPFVAAMLITIGDAETHWSLRIWKNECRVKIGECDRGRARGPWQAHRNAAMTDLEWEAMSQPTVEGTAVGARRAALLIRYGVNVCGQDPACVLRVYAGKGPTSNWPGLGVRLQTFSSVRGRI